MKVIWWWTVRSVRRRARAYVGVAVLLALLGAVLSLFWTNRLI